ncbi:MAG: hypothetical protein A2887_06585 [Alphaproteobacteria bacterium RIFCSPLOWO2_01_FULL_40_26]|nr:MAG: hypothetical protein A3D15_04115 [Alphaproteobacteria bacterium RIFCSPHIGHO2_02_FULL_40_34]OFW94086.1 MAG: hypothetical protein A2887_06585 [Alphaproteobacteria bacterium RIFCSPLOWO2_01_FULL_40_26]
MTKSSLSHLPKNKQSELKKIIATIRDIADVEMIILFGSYARGNWREARDVIADKPGFRRISDYDILIITEKKDKSSWHKISSKCQKLKLSAPVRVEAHDIEMLNIKLAEGQYFFSDIKKEGIMIYDSKRFELVEKGKLKPQEEQRIIKDYFEHWFEKAESFWKTFKIMMKDKNFTRAAFDLHQTAEHAYKTIHLVFTNYLPHEHFLALLAVEINHLNPDLKKLFSQKTEEQKARLKLLEYAYIGGRYDADFYMAKEDLEILSKDVKRLLELTKKICKQKIVEMK